MERSKLYGANSLKKQEEVEEDDQTSFSSSASGSKLVTKILPGAALQRSMSSRQSNSLPDKIFNFTDIPCYHSNSSGSNKKRKSDQMEEEHLKEVQRIKIEHLQERNKIKKQQDREVKHLNLKHNIKIQEAKLEEAKKELEDFEAEGTAD